MLYRRNVQYSLKVMQILNIYKARKSIAYICSLWFMVPDYRWFTIMGLFMFIVMVARCGIFDLIARGELPLFMTLLLKRINKVKNINSSFPDDTYQISVLSISGDVLKLLQNLYSRIFTQWCNLVCFRFADIATFHSQRILSSKILS